MNKKNEKDEPKPGDKDFYVHLEYPYNRPGPGNGKDLKLTPTTPKEFNYAYPSVPDITHINWKEVKNCAVSEEGQSGVIYLHGNDGNFVIKGAADPALELFGNLLYAELNIKVPAMRIIEFSNPEFSKAVASIDKASYYDNSIKHKIRNRLDRPYLLLMEYIPGLRIHQLGNLRAKECFDASYPKGRDRLINIGIILAADVFINNFDRYPMIWNSNGSPENLIVKFETDWNTKNHELFDQNNLDLPMQGVYAVCNKPSLFGKENKYAEDNYDKYLQTLEELLKSLFVTLKLIKDGKLNPFDTKTRRLEYSSVVSTFIYNHTTVDIKTLGELQILLGLCLGFANIAAMGFDIIDNIKNKVIASVTKDYKGFWKDNCDSIKLGILRDELSIITKYIRENEDILGWANVITLNNYLLKYDFQTGLGEGQSSILSYVDEQHNRTQVPSSHNHDNWLDKKIHEYFGLDASNIEDNPGNITSQGRVDKSGIKGQINGRTNNNSLNNTQSRILRGDPDYV